jgi:O-antigen/teichoic acid export membrane protein
VLTLAAAVLAPALFGVPLALTLLVCAAAWCSVASSVASELGLALGRPGLWNLRFPVENALVVAAVPLGYALAGADAAIAGMACACVLTFVLLFGRLAADLHRAAAGGELPPGAAAYARLETVSVVLGTTIKRGGPLAMALARASSVQTGFAAIATGAGAAGAATMIDLLIVHLPRLVRLRADAPERAASEAERTARVGLLVAMATALPAAVLAGPAIHLLLGSEFSGARDAVVLALPSVPLGAALGMATAVASLELRPRALAWSWVAGAAVFAAGAAVLIPAHDAVGAAVAMTGGLLVAALASAVLVGGRELRRICAAAVAGAVAVAAAGLIAG